MRLEQYLTEKTFNIGQDVDKIFKKMIKPTLDLFKKGKYREFERAIDSGVISSMSSGELTSRQAKQAHEINPIMIGFVINEQGNHYTPPNKQIQISINHQVLDIIRDNNYDEAGIRREIGDKSYDRFMNELSDSSIKGSIYHEVSHWLNDTFHNQNIAKVVGAAEKAGENGYDVLKQGHSHNTQTDYELDAQIHALKQLKRDQKKKYETLGWREIMILKPSFTLVFSRASLSNEYESFMKRLTKRMHREKLLTKKLQKYPKANVMYMLTRSV